MVTNWYDSYTHNVGSQTQENILRTIPLKPNSNTGKTSSEVRTLALLGGERVSGDALGVDDVRFPVGTGHCVPVGQFGSSSRAASVCPGCVCCASTRRSNHAIINKLSSWLVPRPDRRAIGARLQFRF